MIHAGLAFAAVIPVALIVGSLWFAVSLCKAARRGAEPRAGLSERDVALCQSRQRSRRVTVMTGACGLTPDLVSNRGRGAETPDRTIEERKLPDGR